MAQEVNIKYIVASRAIETLIIQPMPEREKEGEGE